MSTSTNNGKDDIYGKKLKVAEAWLKDSVKKKTYFSLEIYYVRYLKLRAMESYFLNYMIFRGNFYGDRKGWFFWGMKMIKRDLGISTRTQSRLVQSLETKYKYLLTKKKNGRRHIRIDIDKITKDLAKALGISPPDLEKYD